MIPLERHMTTTQLESVTEQLWERWPSLSRRQRAREFRELHTGDRADFFLELSAHDQRDLLLDLPQEQRHVWMRLLAPDDAADVVQEVDAERRDEMLQLLDEPTRREVTALLAYKEDEAGGLMNPRFARLRPELTVDEAISYLRKEAPAVVQIYYAYVLDQEQHLLGVVSVRQLFSADPQRPIREVMKTDLVWVTPEADQRDVAMVARESRLLAVPVFDGQRRMVGIVTVDDIAEQIRDGNGKFDKVLELIGVTTLEDSLQCSKEAGIVCMTGIVGNKWSFDHFAPMEAIPTSVCLTSYAGEVEDFMKTPLKELCDQIGAGELHVQVGKVFRLDQIVEAHRLMEENKAGGKIVVLT